MSSIQSLLQFRYEKKGIEKIQKEKVESNHDNPKSEAEGTLIKYRIQKADTPTKNNQDNGILKYYKALFIERNLPITTQGVRIDQINCLIKNKFLNVLFVNK